MSKIPDKVCVDRRVALYVAETEAAFRELGVKKNGDGPCGKHYRRAQKAAHRAVSALERGKDKRAVRAIGGIIKSLRAAARCET